MTQDGCDPLPLEEDHCSVVEVTEEEVQNSVKFVPSLSTVVRSLKCVYVCVRMPLCLPAFMDVQKCVCVVMGLCVRV